MILSGLFLVIVASDRWKGMAIRLCFSWTFTFYSLLRTDH